MFRFGNVLAASLVLIVLAVLAGTVVVCGDVRQNNAQNNSNANAQSAKSPRPTPTPFPRYIAEKEVRMRPVCSAQFEFCVELPSVPDPPDTTHGLGGDYRYSTFKEKGQPTDYKFHVELTWSIRDGQAIFCTDRFDELCHNGDADPVERRIRYTESYLVWVRRSRGPLQPKAIDVCGPNKLAAHGIGRFNGRRAFWERCPRNFRLFIVRRGGYEYTLISDSSRERPTFSRQFEKSFVLVD